jgi:hypothetical protein
MTKITVDGFSPARLSALCVFAVSLFPAVASSEPQDARSIRARIAACIADFADPDVVKRRAAIEAVRKENYLDAKFALEEAKRDSRGAIRLCAEIALHHIEADGLERTMGTLAQVKITLDIEHATLDDITDFIRSAAFLNIAASGDVKEKGPISLAEKDRSVEQILDGLCHRHGLTYTVEDGTLVLAPQPPDAAAPPNEHGRPLGEAVDRHLADFADPDPKKRLAAIAALQTIRDLDLDAALENALNDPRGAVRLCTAIARHRRQADDLERWLAVLGHRITVEFRDAGMRDMFDYLRECAGVNLDISGDAGSSDHRFSIEAKNEPFDHVLDRLFAPSDLKYAVERDRIHITLKPRPQE